MATVPLWAIGKHTTAAVLTPQTKNATTGVLTDTTPVQNIFGHLREVAIESEIDVEEISHMGAPAKNNVNVQYGITWKFTELEKSAGVNMLAQLWNSNTEYVKIQLTRGAQSWTGYGLIGNSSINIDKRSDTNTLVLHPVDAGGTSYT